MSVPRKTLKKEAAIRTSAAKAPTGTGSLKAAPKTAVGTVKAPGKTGLLAGGVGSRAAKPIGQAIGGKGKGRGPVYETPKPVRPRTTKK